MNMLPLFEYYPSIQSHVPYISLGSFPTPVIRLDNLSKYLSVPSIWMKRDDISGVIYGGNKVRKLEFVFGKVIDRGYKKILAYGSIGSNFTIACCMYGKEINIPVDLVLYKTSLTDSVIHNYKLNQRLSGSMSIYSSISGVVYGILKRMVSSLNTYYLMPPGGSSPQSALGYINAMFELYDQIKNGEIPMPDYIFLPVGTGGTLIGLLIGKVILKIPVKIIGISVVDKILTSQTILKIQIYRVVRYFNRISGYNLSSDKVIKELNIDYNFLGRGYTYPTESGVNAIDLLKTHEGISLDTSYTGKAMAGMLYYIQSSIKPDSNVLFWNTLNSRIITFLISIIFLFNKENNHLNLIIS